MYDKFEPCKKCGMPYGSHAIAENSGYCKEYESSSKEIMILKQKLNNLKTLLEQILTTMPSCIECNKPATRYNNDIAAPDGIILCDDCGNNYQFIKDFDNAEIIRNIIKEISK